MAKLVSNVDVPSSRLMTILSAKEKKGQSKEGGGYAVANKSLTLPGLWEGMQLRSFKFRDSSSCPFGTP
jgi:hypothetical protein